MNAGNTSSLSENYTYAIPNRTITGLNEVFIQIHSADSFSPHENGFLNLHPESIEINSALFISEKQNNVSTLVIQENNSLLLSCSCCSVSDKLCPHQSQALYNILTRAELRIFFDEILRAHTLRKFAEPYGLQHEKNIEQYFLLAYHNGSVSVKPASASLVPLTADTLKFRENLLLDSYLPKTVSNPDKETLVIFKQHRYYRHLQIELYEAALTQNGKPKNPLKFINASEKVWHSENPTESKFYFGIGQFQHKITAERSAPELDALKAVCKNPMQLRFYQHISGSSENIVAGALSPIQLGAIIHSLELSVDLKEPFYEVSAAIYLNQHRHPLDDVTIKFQYFLEIDNAFHLAGNLKLLSTVEFFKAHSNTLLIHQSKYPEFRENILVKLEEYAEINYAYLPPATPEQLAENNLNQPPERFIYLKDADPYVELHPVMKYGNHEISILSKRQVYPKGIKTGFIIQRDKAAEFDFIRQITHQHPYFEEQMEDVLPFFYLHKKHFLNEDWFLRVFEKWQSQAIRILGFNTLKGNKLNPNPVKITIRLLSGTDWFNADIDVRYGKKKAGLVAISRAIRNKSKYIPLDDGTLGILPQEWLEKFTAYFSSGDIEDDTLKIAKSNFSVITALFDDEQIDRQVKAELALFNKKLLHFEAIEDTPVPPDLKAELRDYQKQGLNWLNFLDDFNLGGCLADDMGLGKSVQILAFILSQRGKRADNTNLLVVPTSLIFNWQAEVRKFAPSLKLHTLYGTGRSLDTKQFGQYELILTSYGTLLSDIRFLKNYTFNYVFLDESQNIKNPDSQRYKAACLLKSRNKIAITGTPVENNTFDLYAQLSFACPGLLGSKQYFKDIYSNPIDTFSDSKRALELQQKIQPFILRRTKAEVLKELPEKTEMVIHCAMDAAQRGIYDAFEKEFREFICSKTEEEIPKSSMHVLKGLTRLRQICNSPLLLHDDEINEKASGKIATLLEQIRTKSPQHKILVFSQFVSMLELIKKALTEEEIPFCYLTGSTKNRSEVVKEFQDDVTKRVFLISLKAGGTGLNLTQADYVYLVDPWWNPAVENQAIDRIYRIGQKKNIVAVRLICPDTVEEKILNMQESKKDLFNNLILSDAGMAKSFTKSELLGLLNKE
ncbi:ATP-dependent helicase (plasmid) [Pedobacter sp. BS3]|uniref:DEAD/DEAH box helicase n=1 Tax=Pedobacter sp. BS3 TaxID=2567937 RepID=UPI0011EF7B13|nr:DEAD/DEAH box helicase [Pedobacter sp. BS3]TZF85845.1 ATP-dependent helicase [Pedobacter sp. BS3]